MKKAVSLAVITSLLFSSLSAQCCDIVDPCFLPGAQPCMPQPYYGGQPRDSWMQRNGFPLVGGILLGAAAGALAGWGVCQGNKNNNNSTLCCPKRNRRIRRGRDGRDFHLDRDREGNNLAIAFNLSLEKPL